MALPNGAVTENSQAQLANREEQKLYQNNSIVTLNVGGRIFQTYQGTLQRFSGTRLAQLSPESDEYQREDGVYFFDRDPLSFAAILELYRTGELHMNHCVCSEAFAKELSYWSIPSIDRHLSACCQERYYKKARKHVRAEQLERTFAFWRVHQTLRAEQGDWDRFANKAWRFLDDPYSSLGAFIWGIFHLLLSLLVVFAFTADSTLLFRHRLESTNEFNASSILTTLEQHWHNNRRLLLYLSTRTHHYIYAIDIFCAFVFTIDFLLRLIFAPVKMKFLLSPMTLVVDAFVIIPMWVVIMTAWFHPGSDYQPYFIMASTLLQMTRVFRVFRVFMFASKYSGLRVILLAILRSRKELLLLLVILFMLMVVFGTVAYFAEFAEGEGDFENIPKCFWWAVVTLTTLGYGDIAPKTWGGYAVATCCVICGLVVMTLPIPIVGNNFNELYSYARQQSDFKIAQKWKKIKARVRVNLAIKRSRSASPTSDNIPESRETVL